jgi:hypothetical protein
MALLRSDTGQFLPYILVLLQASTWGRCPPKSILLLGHAPSPSPHFRLAQTSFDPNFYLYTYPSNLLQVTENTDAGESLKRQNVIFTTRQKFEIKNKIMQLQMTEDDLWIISWKWAERKWPGFNFRHSNDICLQGLRKLAMLNCK